MAASAEAKAAMLLVAQLEAQQFVADHFFTMAPEAFRSAPAESYHEFRGEVSEILQIPADDVCLIGSGRLGFSLNPQHLLQPFRRESDLDLVVVSSERFDASWAELIQGKEQFLLAGEDEARRFKKTKENFFNGYLRPDQMPLTSEISRDWFPKLAGPFQNPIARKHVVRAWLFKGWDHARACYIPHLASVRADVTKILKLRGDLQDGD